MSVRFWKCPNGGIVWDGKLLTPKPRKRVSLYRNGGWGGMLSFFTRNWIYRVTF